jgi:hypothetical protein
MLCSAHGVLVFPLEVETSPRHQTHLALPGHCFFPSRRHAQSLAALQAYSHWLAQYCGEAHRQNTQQFVTLISTTMDAITPLISTKVLRQKMLHFLPNSDSLYSPVYHKTKMLS